MALVKVRDKVLKIGSNYWDEFTTSSMSLFLTLIGSTYYYNILLHDASIDEYVQYCKSFCKYCQIEKKSRNYISTLDYINMVDLNDPAFSRLCSYWYLLCERHLVPVALHLFLESKNVVKKIRYLPDLKVFAVSIYLRLSRTSSGDSYFLNILIARNNIIALVTYRYSYIPVTFIFNYNANSETYNFMLSILNKRGIDLSQYQLRERVENIGSCGYKSTIKVIDSLLYIFNTDNVDLKYDETALKLYWTESTRKYNHSILLEIDFNRRYLKYDFDRVFIIEIRENRVTRSGFPYFGYKIQLSCYESILETLLDFLHEECALSDDEERKLREEILSEIDDEKRMVTEQFWTLLKEYLNAFIISEKDVVIE